MKKNVYKPTILILVLFFSLASAYSQVGVGTNSPNASASLDVSSTSKGFLPPRMTALQRAAIASPATGLLVYQTDGTSGVYVYNGSSWTVIGSTPPPVFLTKSANYTITTADVTGELYLVVSGTTPRTFTLPSAAAVGAGKKISLASGNLAFPNLINVVRSGSDTIYGSYTLPGTTDFYAATNYYPVALSLVSDGIGTWYIYSLY
jgi:hypothetical protein